METGNLYRLYLKAANLPAGGLNLTIEKATIEKVHPRPAEEITRALAWFRDRQGRLRALILNQGNYNRLVNLTGSTDTDKWVGVEVHLKPGKWGANDTVILDRPKNGKGVPTNT